RHPILNPVKGVPDSIELQGIFVKKERPPKGKVPVEWLRKLVSEAASKPVETVGEAYTRVGYYMRRRQIERFHYVLKSGHTMDKL
ncbi:MAG: hypothetical protein LBD47_04180, partial [Treponema sp.]|nr:hypothetical protein [Treponema sp.]